MPDTETNKRLSHLTPGARARIKTLRATGAERRRLMDIGFIPGASVEVEIENPLGDPTAYRILGGVFAIRREQADKIDIVEIIGENG